jgi:hypothetical protein
VTKAIDQNRLGTWVEELTQEWKETNLAALVTAAGSAQIASNILEHMWGISKTPVAGRRST